MSIIVAVRKGDTAVIGADTAESEDDLVISADYIVNHSKLLRAGDSVLGMAGWSATQHIIESVVRSKAVELNFSSGADIFETSRKLHEVMKSDYFMDPQEEKEQPVESSQISALIVNPSGIFELESYRSVAQYTKFWAIGSGKRLAIGAMHAAYDVLDDASAIAEAGMRAACQFDDGCSLPLEMVSVPLAPSHPL
ncbi:MAG: MFS transporter [Gammaproteobacteria bacterium]